MLERLKPLLRTLGFIRLPRIENRDQLRAAVLAEMKAELADARKAMAAGRGQEAKEKIGSTSLSILCPTTLARLLAWQLKKVARFFFSDTPRGFDLEQVKVTKRCIENLSGPKP